MLHAAQLERQAARERGVRDRPAAHRARRRAGQPASRVRRATRARTASTRRPGAKFYPIYTLTQANGRCWFQQGGAHIPGTVNTFGGNSRHGVRHQVLFVHLRRRRLQADPAGGGLPPRPARQSVRGRSPLTACPGAAFAPPRAHLPRRSSRAGSPRGRGRRGRPRRGCSSAVTTRADRVAPGRKRHAEPALGVGAHVTGRAPAGHDEGAVRERRGWQVRFPCRSAMGRWASHPR